MPRETRLKVARAERGWSQSKVARLLDQRAVGRGLPSRSPQSRQSELSRWENGRVTPDRDARSIFRELYGKTNEELGFPPEALPDHAGAELSERLAIANRVDNDTIALFRDQIGAVRRADRRFGAAVQLEQLRTQIDQLEDLLRHSIMPHARAPLAAVLTEASTLAGWGSLDSGSISQAWAHYERAKLAAAESDSRSVLAHATAEQAFVLIDAGHARDASALLAEARSIGDRSPALLRAWLAAAAGEASAVAGDRGRTLSAFDEADALLPAETTHPELPFIFLGGSHLHRWRGNALVYLGDPAVTQHLERIAHDLRHSPFVRATAAVHVDLATAHAAAGNRAAAERHATQARHMISQLGSVRLRRRLQRLVLPERSAST